MIGDARHRGGYDPMHFDAPHRCRAIYTMVPLASAVLLAGVIAVTDIGLATVSGTAPNALAQVATWGTPPPMLASTPASHRSRSSPRRTHSSPMPPACVSHGIRRLLACGLGSDAGQRRQEEAMGRGIAKPDRTGSAPGPRPRRWWLACQTGWSPARSRMVSICLRTIRRTPSPITRMAASPIRRGSAGRDPVPARRGGCNCHPSSARG